MILTIFLLASSVYSYSEQEFNYSVIRQPPWKLTDCDKPYNGTNKIQCPMCDSSGQCTIHVAVILPASDYYVVNLERAKNVLESARNFSMQKYIPHNVNIDFKYYDDKCSSDTASSSVVEAIQDNKCIHVIFGPICDYSLATVGRMAKYIGAPLITPGGFSEDFTGQKTNFEEFFFVANLGMVDYRSYGEFLHLIFERYNWKKIVLMYLKPDQSEIAGENACYLSMTNIVNELINFDYVDGDIGLLGNNYTEVLINKVGVNYGIIATCASHQNLRNIVIEATKLKMMDRGEYVFFNLEFYNNAEDPSRPWYQSNDTEENNELARKGFESVFSLMPYRETNFEEVKNQTRGLIYLDSLYDGLLLYAQVINQTLNETEADQTVYSGQMFYKMMGKTFKGKNDDIQMNCNVQRTAKYALLNINANGESDIVGVYSTVNKTVEYWNVTWRHGIPSDTPKCGFDLSKCPTYDVVKILVICLIAVTVVGLAVVSIISYRQIKLRSEIEARAWKVKPFEIVPTKLKNRSSFSSAISMRDRDSATILSFGKSSTELAFFKSNHVVVKYLQNVKIEPNRKELYELKIMKDLSHDNLVKFYGACFDQPNFILIEYCLRGSLKDVLEGQTSWKLDWPFRLSLMMDLVSGMNYLHRSPIKSHGALKSSNCLVDSRFALKIADFGLNFLRQYDTDPDILNEDTDYYWKRQLWTAPELLRANPFPPGGSQKGDVYSFGIIMNEIIVRQGTFYLQDRTLFAQVDEITTNALTDVKPEKAPGFDGVHPEFLIHAGNFTKLWLARFFTAIMKSGNFPAKLKHAKIIAILKPGKPADLPQSYRPIALLSSLYKLYERVLYNRLSPIVFANIPIEQAGFRPNRSCSDQVMSLTSYIEAGFQRKHKTSAVFIDLSAAYDTVWRHGLLNKLIKLIPCLRIIKLIDSMIFGRGFRVIMGEKMSKRKILNNGLPQGSVLAPLLFNLYIADMPETSCRKFGYADDWVIATRHESLEITEQVLTSDLSLLADYFRKWRLKPNVSKTETSCFHLNNRLANRELEVYFEGKRLLHNKQPTYLGLTLDRTLSFKAHLTKLAAKIRTRNNIIQKLCGTTWGSSAQTLRTSALSLVYSTAEYCAPVWLNSAHVNKVDVQLNNTMRIISGSIRTTPTYWLPVLSNIPPPNLRRKQALQRELKKVLLNQDLPVHSDIADLNINRLRSRKPPLSTNTLGNTGDNSEFNLCDAWMNEWMENAPPQYHELPCISEEPPGFKQPRKRWVTLNRLRTEHGRCMDSLYKWGKVPTPACNCGAPRQTIRHIREECAFTAYEGDLGDFLKATPSAIEYIKRLNVCL